MNILLTGGNGYIGSHICMELLVEDHNIIVLDNLSNSSEYMMQYIAGISNGKIKFYQSDLLNINEIRRIFQENSIDVVIHLAGLKSVFESQLEPFKYYKNNVQGTFNLCEIMVEYSVKKIIFSSSATVYDLNNYTALSEESVVRPSNPYGETKLIVEHFLKDIYESDNEWSISILRYFNPIGAHTSGLVGELPSVYPSNIVPLIMKVVSGELPTFNIFGNDYDTFDGTCMRDYIHVTDLARGHLASLYNLVSETGVNIYNLGTGKAYSVLELVNTFEKIINKKIPYKFVERRKGDIPVNFADPSKAMKELNWCAKLNLEDMCRDVWRWELNKERFCNRI